MRLEFKFVHAPTSDMPDTMELYTGETITVDHVESLPTGGARFDITANDGRKWRIDVDRDSDVDVVTTWRDGSLADLDVPEWMDDVAARLLRS
jgi:hypothetical protein